MTIQERSTRGEKRWNRAVGSVIDALTDFAEIADDSGISVELRNDLELKRLAILSSINAYCDHIRNCATAGGVTVNSAPGPKEND